MMGREEALRMGNGAGSRGAARHICWQHEVAGGVGRQATDASGITGTVTGPAGYMGDCIARRDLPARMVSPMEGDCRERGFVKESGAHARMEWAPRCEIAEGERRDAGLPRRAGGRARAGACRGEETATRRGGEGRSRRGGEGISPACTGRERGFVKESGTHARTEGAPRCEIAEGSAAMWDCVAAPGEGEGGRLPRRGDRGEEGRRGEIAARRGGDLAGLRGMEGGGCGRGEGARGRGHASADLAGLRGMEEEAGGSAMAEPKLWTPTVKA
jgi:hypothetical protein